MNDRMTTITPDLPGSFTTDGMLKDELMVDAPRKEMAAWYDAIVKDEPPLATAKQGLIVTKVLDAVYKSAETGHPIYF